MAKGVQSLRRAADPSNLGASLGDPLNKEMQRSKRKLEKKGWFPESNYLQDKKEKKQRKEEIKLQQQQETARVEEAQSEVERKRFLAKAGGRRSLIASK